MAASWCSAPAKASKRRAKRFGGKPTSIDVPRLAFINKMDREGAEFETVYEEIGNRLGAQPVALQIPVGQGPAHTANPFRGIIDLVKMKLLTFPEGKEGTKVVASEIADQDLSGEAQLWRERMLESLYNYSNELMELALAEEPIPEALIHKVVREATLHLADSAGAVWFGAARRRRRTDSRCGGRVSAESDGRAAGRRRRRGSKAQGQRQIGRSCDR